MIGEIAVELIYKDLIAFSSVFELLVWLMKLSYGESSYSFLNFSTYESLIYSASFLS